MLTGPFLTLGSGARVGGHIGTCFLYGEHSHWKPSGDAERILGDAEQQIG